MRKIAEFKNDDDSKVAMIYRNVEWEEWVVCFYTDGKHNEAADYYTADKQDAVNTAKYVVGGGR